MGKKGLIWFLSVPLPVAALIGVIATVVILIGHAARHASQVLPGVPGVSGPMPTPNVTPTTFTTAAGMSGWTTQLPNGDALATPAVLNGRVYVGGGFTTYDMYALDASTGAIMWARRLPDDGPTAPSVQDGAVAISTESCTLVVLDESTGNELWTKWLGDPLTSQQSVADGRVYAAHPATGPSPYALTCLDLKTGTQFWTVDLPADVITAPVCEGDSIYLATYDGSVRRCSTRDGSTTWVRTLDATTAPRVADGRVYVTRRESTHEAAGETVYEGVCALDPDDGQDVSTGLWGKRKAQYLSYTTQAQSPYAQQVAASDAAVGFGGARQWGMGGKPTLGAGGYASEQVGQDSVRGVWEYQGSRVAVAGTRIFSTMGGVVQCLDSQTGDAEWEADVQGSHQGAGGHFATPSALAGEHLYVGTVGGEVVCLKQEDGQEVWRHQTGAPIRYEPAVADGRVYVGTTTGAVICIDTGDANADGWPMWGGGAGHNGPEQAAIQVTAAPGSPSS